MARLLMSDSAVISNTGSIGLSLIDSDGSSVLDSLIANNS